MTTELKPENGSLPAERTERVVAMVTDDGPFAYLLDTAKFNHCWRIAQAFSKSQLVPQQFQNNPENCFVAIQAAVRMGVDPFMFLQNCYVIHGKPSIEAKLAIALLNASGKIKGTIKYALDGTGMQRKSTAMVIDAGTGELVEFSVSMADAKAEGWIDKKDSKWKTIPDLMLRYRSAAWLIKTHYPEVLMGMHTQDELEDMCTVDALPPRDNRRVAPVERLESTGAKSHQTSGDFRKLDIPPDYCEALESLLRQGKGDLIPDLTRDAISGAGDNQEMAARIQSAGDMAMAEVGRKSQKELV